MELRGITPDHWWKLLSSWDVATSMLTYPLRGFDYQPRFWSSLGEAWTCGFIRAWATRSTTMSWRPYARSWRSSNPQHSAFITVRQKIQLSRGTLLHVPNTFSQIPEIPLLPGNLAVLHREFDQPARLHRPHKNAALP